MGTAATRLRHIPSVDDILKTTAAVAACGVYGRTQVLAEIRRQVDHARAALHKGAVADVDSAALMASVLSRLARDALPNVRPVFNLTGVVLHTNLGRAVLAEEAVEAAVATMRKTMALEFDLRNGKRGERDDLVRDLLCELTGAEDATIVNNNAAAVLLVLNTFAKGREAIVSRGELIEIGGAFRMPDIMARAGTKLVEVGTTNRTHERDYESALTARTGLILKVHTSNYRIEGFTKTIPAKAIATLAHVKHVPLVNDLGSGVLVDLVRFGLAHEPTVSEAVAEGADLVTFSGDKLLGGPQAGFIVGRRDLIARLNKNPMKRALRMDKIRLAAIEATLRLYRDPDRLAERLPTIRHIARSKTDIAAMASRLLPVMSDAVGPRFGVEVVNCESQIGSGALPQETIASAGLAIRALGKRGSGRAVTALSSGFRALPVPVIGRIEDQSFILDLRCLEDVAGFADNLRALGVVASRQPEAR